MTTLRAERPASERELTDLALSRRPTRYSRRRAAVLIGVYALMALHVAHWQLAERSLAPLELSEVMVTLELGIVTAGFIFMSLAVASVLVVGRFFCSWGCHILALEDSCAWIMKKLGIRPRPIRSRVLLLVPPAAMFYMFIWPQIARLAVNTWPALETQLGARPEFALRVLTDDAGEWASFVTQDFWRNLPGPGIITLTFLICGFAIVYLLGSRSFCSYGCPYGVLFRVADRLSPGRIVNGADCVQCNRCTTVCPSGIDVRREIADHGAVVNSRCLKDLNCVAVCPTQGLRFGFGRPALLRRSAPRRFDFSWGEEILMALVFLVALGVFRGLYGRVPFLMSIGTGAILSYLAVLTLRLVVRDSLRLRTGWLKRSGRLTGSGTAFAATMVVVGGLVLHSGFIRYHEWQSRRVAALTHTRSSTDAAPTGETASRLLGHLETRWRWGLYRGPELVEALAVARLDAGRADEAESLLGSLVARWPNNPGPRLHWARSLVACGRPSDAERCLAPLLAAVETLAPRLLSSAHVILATIAEAQGDAAGTLREYDQAVALDPGHLPARMGRAATRAAVGRLSDAEEDLKEVLASFPGHAPALYNLGVIHALCGRDGEAIDCYRAALQGSPRDPEIHNNLGFVLARQGDVATAEEHLRTAIRLDPRYAEPHYNLARLLSARGRAREADEELHRAAELGLRTR